MYSRVKTSKQYIAKKVLIVESDRLTRSVLSKIMTNYLNCDVNIASSKHEAESFIRSVHYDLFVVGVTRDTEKYLELIRRMRVSDKNVPVVIVTGDCPEEDLEMIKAAGIDRIVYKPLKLTPFLETVADAFIASERVFNYA